MLPTVLEVECVLTVQTYKMLIRTVIPVILAVDDTAATQIPRQAHDTHIF